MKIVLGAIKNAPAEEASSIVDSIRASFTLEDLVQSIQVRSEAATEASSSSFGSPSASGDFESPSKQTVNLHRNSPENSPYSSYDRATYDEGGLDLPPITGSHGMSMQGTKLPVFEADPVRSQAHHSYHEHDHYRRFPGL